MNADEDDDKEDDDKEDEDEEEEVEEYEGDTGVEESCWKLVGACICRGEFSESGGLLF